jgi:hypothetical protein
MGARATANPYNQTRLEKPSRLLPPSQRLSRSLGELVNQRPRLRSAGILDSASNIHRHRATGPYRFGDIVDRQSAGKHPGDVRILAGPSADRLPVEPLAASAVTCSRVSVQQQSTSGVQPFPRTIVDRLRTNRLGRQLDRPNHADTTADQFASQIDRLVAVKLNVIEPDRLHRSLDLVGLIVHKDANPRQSKLTSTSRKLSGRRAGRIQIPDALGKEIQSNGPGGGLRHRHEVMIKTNTADLDVKHNSLPILQGSPHYKPCKPLIPLVPSAPSIR